MSYVFLRQGSWDAIWFVQTCLQAFCVHVCGCFAQD